MLEEKYTWRIKFIKNDDWASDKDSSHDDKDLDKMQVAIAVIIITLWIENKQK